MSEKLSKWKHGEEENKNYEHEILAFVSCYLTFSGVAGICDECVGKKYCLGINADNGHEVNSLYYTNFGDKWPDGSGGVLE